MDTSGKLWIREGNLIVDQQGGHYALDRVAQASNDGSGDSTITAADGETEIFTNKLFGAGLNTPDGLSTYAVYVVMQLTKSANNGLVTGKLYMGPSGDMTDTMVAMSEEHHSTVNPNFQIVMLAHLTPAVGDRYGFTITTATNSVVVRAGDTSGYYSNITSQKIT